MFDAVSHAAALSSSDSFCSLLLHLENNCLFYIRFLSRTNLWGTGQEKRFLRKQRVEETKWFSFANICRFVCLQEFKLLLCSDTHCKMTQILLQCFSHVFLEHRRCGLYLFVLFSFFPYILILFWLGISGFGRVSVFLVWNLWSKPSSTTNRLRSVPTFLLICFTIQKQMTSYIFNEFVYGSLLFLTK